MVYEIVKVKIVNDNKAVNLTINHRCQPLRNIITSILNWKYLSSWIAEFWGICEINDVSYVPSLRYNLLSVTYLMKRGCKIKIANNCVLTFDKDDELVQ